jgi:hypothetical protein
MASLDPQTRVDMQPTPQRRGIGGFLKLCAICWAGIECRRAATGTGPTCSLWLPWVLLGAQETEFTRANLRAPVWASTKPRLLPTVSFPSHSKTGRSYTLVRLPCLFQMRPSSYCAEFGYPLVYRLALTLGLSLTREQRKNIIPIYAAALLAALVPVLCFAVFQIRKRSFQSFSTATMGVLISLITAALFQVFLKWLIGGLRPVSKPVILCYTDLPVPALSRRLQAECHGARNRVPPDLL